VFILSAFLFCLCRFDCARVDEHWPAKLKSSCGCDEDEEEKEKDKKEQAANVSSGHDSRPSGVAPRTMTDEKSISRS
jgi:hypothetical protein